MPCQATLEVFDVASALVLRECAFGSSIASNIFILVELVVEVNRHAVGFVCQSLISSARLEIRIK
jgi:hypothetical protein